MRDRALDVEQDLEQSVALAHHPLGLLRRHAAQGEPEDAGHAGQQRALVGAEGRVAAGGDEPARPVAVEGGAGHVAAADARKVERLVAVAGADERDGAEGGRGGQGVADDDGPDVGSEELGGPLGRGRDRCFGARMRADGRQELDELIGR